MTEPIFFKKSIELRVSEFAVLVELGVRTVIASGSSVVTNVPAEVRWAEYPVGPWRYFSRRVAITKRLEGRAYGLKKIHADQGEEK
jgi:hypothetical protein